MDTINATLRLAPILYTRVCPEGIHATVLTTNCFHFFKSPEAPTSITAVRRPSNPLSLYLRAYLLALLITSAPSTVAATTPFINLTQQIT
jgi:hypothetical protein